MRSRWKRLIRDLIPMAIYLVMVFRSYQQLSYQELRYLELSYLELCYLELGRQQHFRTNSR